MFKKTKTNIVLALCVGGVLSTVCVLQPSCSFTHTARSSFLCGVIWVLSLRRKVCRKQCGT